MSSISKSRPLDLLFFALCLSAVGFPFFLLLSNIRQFAVDVPFFDEWIFMGKLLDAAKDGLSIEEVLAPHNEHRIATTTLTYSLGLVFGSWNRISASYFNAFIALLAFLLILIPLHSLRIQLGKIVYLILLILLSALSFSAQAYENWTWGFQIQWYQMLFFSLLTFLMLASTDLNLKKLLAAIICGVITTLTIAGGLIAWPVGFIILLIQKIAPRRKILIATLWIFCGTIVWVLYHRNLEQKSLLQGVSGNIGLILETFVAIVGAPIANWSVSIAEVVGAAGLVVALVTLPIVVRQVLQSQNSNFSRFIRFQIGVFTFALLNCFIIALARYQFGGAKYVIDASRYTTVSALFWISLLMILASLVAIFKSNSYLKAGLFLFVLCLGYGMHLSYGHSKSLWAHRHFILSEFQSALLASSPNLIEDDALRVEAVKRVGLFSKETLEKLKTYKLSLYSPLRNINEVQISENSTKALGSIDYYESKFDADRAIWITRVAGWTVSSTTKGMVNGLILEAKGERIAFLTPKGKRQDVSDSLNIPADTDVAWNYSFSSVDRITQKDLKVYSLDGNRGRIISYAAPEN